MGRPRKTENPIAETTPEQKDTIVNESVEAKQGSNVSKFDDDKDLSPRILEIMRLHPQYEQLWITSHGFVHPEGVPEYLSKDATLYKNKFYNK